MLIRRPDDEEIMMFIHVDDVIVASNNQTEVHRLESRLKERYKLKVIPEVTNFLGIKIIRNRDERKITLKQDGHIHEILERFGMVECNPVLTPGVPGEDYSEMQSDDFNGPYRQAVGALMYLMVATRPDIAFQVGKLSTYNNKPI